jgi:hypothetical protein
VVEPIVDSSFFTVIDYLNRASTRSGWARRAANSTSRCSSTGWPPSGNMASQSTLHTAISPRRTTPSSWPIPPGTNSTPATWSRGASTGDVAVIPVDARKGVMTQTRRHSYLVALLGIGTVALAVNKLDTVGYAQDVLAAIECDYRNVAGGIGLRDVTAASRAGLVVLVLFISPFRAERRMARALVNAAGASRAAPGHDRALSQRGGRHGGRPAGRARRSCDTTLVSCGYTTMLLRHQRRAAQVGGSTHIARPRRR